MFDTVSLFEPATSVALFRALTGVVLIVNNLTLRDYLLWIILDAPPEKPCSRPIRKLAIRMIANKRHLKLALDINLVASIALALGLLTGVACLCALLSLTLIQARNRFILYGGDQVLRFFLIILLISPANAALSIDELLSGSIESGVACIPSWFKWSLTALLSSIYISAGCAKLRFKSWRRGDAMYYAVNHHEISNVADRSIHFPLFVWRIISWSVISLEVLCGLMLWTAYGHLAATLLVGFHVGAAIVLRIHIFSWIMLASLIPLITGAYCDSGTCTSVAREFGVLDAITAIAAALLIIHFFGFRAALINRSLLPRWLRSASTFLWLDYRWNMFCYPLRPVVLHDMRLDVLNSEEGVLLQCSWFDLARRGRFLDHRHRKLAVHLARPSEAALRDGLYSLLAEGLGPSAVQVRISFKRQRLDYPAAQDLSEIQYVALLKNDS